MICYWALQPRDLFNIDDYTVRMNINSASAFVQDDFKITRRLTVSA